MFKFLKDSWKDAKKRVEDEDNARAAASPAAETPAADSGTGHAGRGARVRHASEC
jgi:hypothetical protein